MGIAEAGLLIAGAALRTLLDDTGVRELITYRQWIRQAFDPTKGHNVDSYADAIGVKALRVVADEKIARTTAMFAGMSAGDVVFVLEGATVPVGASQKDQIVDASGVIFKVLELRHLYEVATAFRVEGAT